MSDPVSERTARADFQATSDPALLESADRGEVHLLSYAQLYKLWERQQWATQEIDFTQDRIDWHERIPEEERFQRMYGLSSFFIGEQKVAEELGPMMRAAPTEDLETLVEAVTLYHMVIEGMLALTGQHFILEYNEEVGTLPGFCEGFNNIARDEHRHVAFGARFLREMAQTDPKYGAAIARTLTEVAPIADSVLQPKWYVEGETEVLGASLEETRAFAMKALERRLKVIGLAPVA